MTISYKKKTSLEKHLHEFRDYLFKIQVERLNTNNARVYFLDKKTEEKISIPKDRMVILTEELILSKLNSKSVSDVRNLNLW
ncbi:5032_t:CDS:1, partial [Racocetra persica]